MSVEENIATVNAIYQRANQEKTFAAALQEYATPGYRSHIPGADLDAAGMNGFAGAFFAALPDLDHDIMDVFGSGDRVALRLRLHGTHTGPLETPAGSIPPSNNPIDFEAINVTRFEGNKIAEHWISFDMMTVMQQLGAMQH